MKRLSLLVLFLLFSQPALASNINTQETTTIDATETLNLKTKNLDIASVQDSSTSKSNSIGMNLSGSSGGINGSKANFRSKETLLTRLTGGKVNIDVAEASKLAGAMIVAVDSTGADTDNLNFSTDTLEVSSLSNTNNSASMSGGIGAGSTATLDYANDRKNSKTKTLATIGSGNLTIGDKENSDTQHLNREVENNEIDIYDVESHQGLKAEVDTRLLSEQGLDQIAEDIMKSGMIVNTIKLIATTDKVGVEDFFNETAKTHDTYEAVKEKIATDPALAAQLQDPNLSAQDKEKMLNSITDAVMVKLGYTTHENKIVATDEAGRDGEQVAGFYSTEAHGAYINDQNIDDTAGLVTTAGHEATRAMDDQDGVDFNENREDRTKYAENFGSNLADYTDMAMDINGYDDGMASSNNHTGNNSAHVTTNNAEFSKLDKDKGDNSLTLAGRDLNLQAGSFDVDPLDTKHGFNVVGAKKAEEFTKEEQEKFGPPIDLGNGEVGYVLERLNIDGKLVPVVNGKMINDNGEWVDAPLGGNASIDEFREQQTTPDLDDMTTIRSYPDDKEKEAQVLEGFIPTPTAESPDYPGALQSTVCAAGENRCSSESLPNSNAGAREDFETSGNPPITYGELEKKKDDEEGSYFPGMLPEDRLPAQSGRNR